MCKFKDFIRIKYGSNHILLLLGIFFKYFYKSIYVYEHIIYLTIFPELPEEILSLGQEGQLFETIR